MRATQARTVGMHSTGIYSWDYFLALGRNREAYWSDYLEDLAGKGLQR